MSYTDNSFGMTMPGRIYSRGDYRFGFNGKEKDDEVSGSGNQYDYGFRIYNPRIGRFLSVDPLFKSYPWYSPYQFAGNNPIRFIDLDGKETEDPQNEKHDDNGGVPTAPKDYDRPIKDAFQSDFDEKVKVPIENNPVSKEGLKDYLDTELKGEGGNEYTNRIALVRGVASQVSNEAELQSWKDAPPGKTGDVNSTYTREMSANPAIPKMGYEKTTMGFLWIKTQEQVLEADPKTGTQIEVQPAEYLIIVFQIAVIPDI
jgi:RHS repeat-associated protein